MYKGKKMSYGLINYIITAVKSKKKKKKGCHLRCLESLVTYPSTLHTSRRLRLGLLKQKRPRLSSGTGFCFGMTQEVHTASGPWRKRPQDDLPPAQFASYDPQRIFFSFPEGEVGTGWLLVVPGQLQEEPEGVVWIILPPWNAAKSASELAVTRTKISQRVDY